MPIRTLPALTGALRRPAAGAALSLLLLLSACGGGDVATNGTGATQDSRTVGTVSGFGSVIVDGVRYDDRTARVEVEVRGGEYALTEVKFGQRTAVAFSAPAAGSVFDGVASRIEVEPGLKGRVDSKAADGLSLVVLGQTIRVNLTPGAAPVTVIDGFGSATLAGLAAGDPVEVHAVLQPDGTRLATRIEKQTEAQLATGLRVSGVVSNLSGASFTLGGLTVVRSNATLLPAGATLANGQSVVVFAPLLADGGARLTASAVRVKSGLRVATSLPQTYLSGLVSAVDAATFKVDGITVQGVTPPAAGRYVRVKGAYAASGDFAATEIKLRRSDDLNDDGSASSDPASELHGAISAWTAPTVSAPGSFLLRGVQVSISATVAARFDVRDCAAGTLLGNGVYVEVEGLPSPAGLVAREIKCEGADSSSVSDGTLEPEGSVSNLDTVARTFTVGSQRIAYGASTYFKEFGTVALANGLRVKVEGARSANDSSILVARKIELDDSSDD
jgi:Domain of unknown function (DUF5666)